MPSWHGQGKLLSIGNRLLLVLVIPFAVNYCVGVLTLVNLFCCYWGV